MKHFDYLGSEGDTSYLRTLEAEDELQAIDAGGMDQSLIEGEHIDESVMDESVMAESVMDESVMADELRLRGDGVCRRAGKMMLLGCLLLGAFIWIKVKQLPV
jgi:hypothetical protein